MKQLFQGLTEIIRAASPSIFSFVETTLPYTTPAPIALISAASAASFFGLKGFGAFLFVYSLEGIGLVSTSKLVETVVDFIRGRNLKTLIMIFSLLTVVIVYITILVSLNVKIHTEITDENFSQALTLICYLPLIAGVLNGLSLVKLDFLEDKKKKEEIEETHYQQRRGDSMEIKRLKLGLAPGENKPKEKKSNDKMPGDYKDYVFELLDQYGPGLPLTEITRLVNRDKRVNFIHADAKGTWFKYVQAWKRDHPQ